MGGDINCAVWSTRSSRRGKKKVRKKTTIPYKTGLRGGGEGGKTSVEQRKVLVENHQLGKIREGGKKAPLVKREKKDRTYPGDHMEKKKKKEIPSLNLRKKVFLTKPEGGGQRAGGKKREEVFAGKRGLPLGRNSC